MVDSIPRREAPLTHEIAIMSRQLTLPHDDPAGRFLAASAHLLDLTLGDGRRTIAPFPGGCGDGESVTDHRADG